MSEIRQIGNIWYHHEEILALNKIAKKQEKRVFILMTNDSAYEVMKKRIAKNEDNRKWALIIVGNTQKLAFVDYKTMKAYKADNYQKTWIEIKEYRFVRWASGFDL